MTARKPARWVRCRLCSAELNPAHHYNGFCSTEHRDMARRRAAEARKALADISQRWAGE